ncbi:MAG: hypothetical protein WC229_01495 [Candidatus Paceibacterota bacterium]|jgi:hypothetical protein
MNKKNQILIVVIVVIVGFFVFNYFKNSSVDNSGSSIVAEQRVTEFAGAREILSLLNRMSNVKLDDSIFNDSSFKSLKDTTVVLVGQPVGRNNPFAPLGTDGSRSTSSSASSAPKTQSGSTPFGGSTQR